MSVVNDKKLVVVLTGFGKFQGVEKNPTTEIVQEFKDSSNIGNCSVLVSPTIFETAATTSLETFQGIAEQVTNHPDYGQSNTKFVFVSFRIREHVPLLTFLQLHLGVNGKGKRFALETAAYNCQFTLMNMVHSDSVFRC
jgi:hypothetical protein